MVAKDNKKVVEISGFQIVPVKVKKIQIFPNKSKS